MTVNERIIVGRKLLGTTNASRELCCQQLISNELSVKEAEKAALIFAALADPVRLRILSIIASSEEVCSCQLETPLGKSQPTISHHTRILSEAGLISGDKRGRWIWWRAVTERLREASLLLDVESK